MKNTLEKISHFMISLLRPISFRGKNRLYSLIFSSSPNRLKANVFGAEFELDGSDYIQRSIYWGTFEPKETRWIKKELSAGMTFVDVGANVGYFTALAANRVGPQGKIFSFEPSPRAFNSLDRLVRDNRLNQVKVFPYALGEHTETRELFMPPPELGNHAPSMFSFANGDDSIRTNIRTLDDCFREWNVSRIDLMKIDVEGFEMSVFRGAEKLLQSRKIMAIQCELSDYWLHRAGTSKQEVWDYLLGFGFKNVYGPSATVMDSTPNHFLRMT